jgi:predicted short-subunit dehydrogenase-like oxidoreductase (DUF2520 family)
LESQKVRVGIVGAGKVGISLAFTLKQKGFSVTCISSRSADSLERAKAYLGQDVSLTERNEETVERADVIGITTQDTYIRDVAEGLAQRFQSLSGKIFFHTSGAHSSSLLAPLKERGASVGSLHPLQTFPDVDAAIRGMRKAYVFVEGDEEARGVLLKLGKNLGKRVYEIEGEKKILYHLSAVLVCNLLCAILYSAERILEEIDLPLEPFFPLIETTLSNVKRKGALPSLTGPIVRGDTKTVELHIEALKGKALEREVYRTLSLVALEMAKQRCSIDEERIEEMRELLR